MIQAKNGLNLISVRCSTKCYDHVIWKHVIWKQKECFMLSICFVLVSNISWDLLCNVVNSILLLRLMSLFNYGPQALQEILHLPTPTCTVGRNGIRTKDISLHTEKDTSVYSISSNVSCETSAVDAHYRHHWSTRQECPNISRCAHKGVGRNNASPDGLHVYVGRYLGTPNASQ